MYLICRNCSFENDDQAIYCKACGYNMKPEVYRTRYDRSYPPTETRGSEYDNSHYPATGSGVTLNRRAPMSAPLAFVLAIINSLLPLLYLFMITEYASRGAGPTMMCLLPLLLHIPMAVGLWCLGCGIGGDTPRPCARGGLTTIKVSTIITCVTVLTVLGIVLCVGLSEAFSYLSDPPRRYGYYYDYYDYGYARERATETFLICLVIAGIFVMALLFLLSSLRTIRAMQRGLQSGNYFHGSVFVIVCFFLLATFFAVMLVLSTEVITYSFLPFFLMLLNLANCICYAVFLCSYNARRKRLTM